MHSKTVYKLADNYPLRFQKSWYIKIQGPNCVPEVGDLMVCSPNIIRDASGVPL